METSCILDSVFSWKSYLPAWILLSIFISSPAFAELAPAELEGGWKLVWQDEFNGRSLDLSKWLPAAAALEKNHEAQYYSPNNAYLESGSLVLKSERKKVGKRPYTSALVETTGLFSLTYGRIEVRAKLPGGQGIWPAHWMMPADNSWPPEIDIMELLGHDPSRVYMHLHYGEDWRSHRSTGESFRGLDFTESFHVFAVEWEKDEIRWFIDGVLRHTVRENIPAAQMRIILNTAVGGNWPGYPNKRTQFPQYHLIDYVRVYKREDVGNV